MVQEAIAWGTTPTATDLEDGSQNYNMGAAFTMTIVRDITGVQVFATDTITTPNGGTFAIALWNETTGTRVRYKEVSAPAAGAGLVIYSFDTPFTPNLTDVYVAAWYTVRYAFRAGSPAGLTNPSGGVLMGSGRLSGYNGGAATAPSPAGNLNSTYYIGPVVDVAGSTTPVTSSLTAKWRVYGEVSTPLTGKWRVWQKVSSTLRAKWHVLGGPAPEPTVSTGYLTAQRAATAAFIADDPTTLVLVPRDRVATATGGYTYVDGAPRAAQTVKMVLLSNDQRPVVTVAGVERQIDYHLVGPWNMSIAVGDTWEAEDGTRWEVLGFTEGWDYMTKAFIGRHVPRGVRP